MIIRRMRVHRFRRLADETLEFGPGLNVIRGRNDAGKSTLHLAFSAALYPIRPSEARSLSPWGCDDGPGEITLEFEAGDRRYTLHKDFASRKVCLTDGRRPVDNAKEVERQIGVLLGVPTLALFRATAHIGQWELAQVQKEKDTIGTRLSAIMTGGDEDAARVLRLLDERVRKMELGLRRPSGTPGPLKRDEERLRFLTAEAQRLASEVAAIEQAAADRTKIAERVARLEQQVKEDAALVQANRDLLELDRRVEAQRGRVAELRELTGRIDAAAGDLEAAGRDPALELPDVTPEAIEAVRTAALRAELLRREIASAQGEETRPVPAEMSGRERRAAWMPAGLAAAAGLVSVAFLIGHHTGLGLGAMLAAILLAALAIATRSRAEAAALHAELAAKRRAEEAERVAARRRDAEQAEEALRRDLQTLGAGSVDEAAERQERVAAARRRRETARAVLESLLGARTRAAIADEYQRVVVDLAATEARRDGPDLALRRLDAVAFQRLAVDAERRQRELEHQRAALHTLDGRLSGRSPHEELARVEEELADIRARYARAERQVRVLTLTRDVLAEARGQTIVPGRAMLEERASEYVRRLSGGAYARISVDEQTLAPRVWAGPPKEWADVSAKEIGSGGVDQCYLALRLGLVELLCEGRCPLFLDDPLLAYDEDRQAAAMDFLADLARHRQIFLFTCRTAYDAHADHLTVLDQPAAVPAR